jgi:hypothetical protein
MGLVEVSRLSALIRARLLWDLSNGSAGYLAWMAVRFGFTKLGRQGVAERVELSGGRGFLVRLY